MMYAPPGDVSVKGGLEIDGLTDLKFVGQHDRTIDMPTQHTANSVEMIACS
jgi:hypothetical protein